MPLISAAAVAVNMAGFFYLPLAAQDSRPAMKGPDPATSAATAAPEKLPFAAPSPVAPAAPAGNTVTNLLSVTGATAPAGAELPLSNIDLLNKMDDDRLPTSPRRFLKMRFKQVRKAKDEKILQLLLVCVGFVGVFVAILALRSVPPARSGS
ncbi:MAG: hypothetical protein KGS72_20990 [Cyanobacteria bacterium REEB67]|nr:hypothetical protein [Cyanobacteria bacterium REEB67]